jgi:hypothetical protein
VKYMILLYGSQQDYDSMSGKDAAGRDAWTGADFAALGAFMESFTKDLATSGELVETRGLLELAGDRAAAREAYLAAASRTSNLPQQRYLHARAAGLAGHE